MKVLRAFNGLKRSPNEFIAVHNHVQGASGNQMALWDLPDEILVHLLKNLHIKDLLSVLQVHRYFGRLVDTNQSVWASVRFEQTWPSLRNLHHFEKAASVGNIQALVKLAIAYLYNEGLPVGDDDGQKVTRNGLKSAEMFCRIEGLTPNTDPFTWLFIRPPWSANGACCKECVFNYMKTHVEKSPCRKVQVCVAKTLQLLNKEKNEIEMKQYLSEAADVGSGIAAYTLWQQQKAKVQMCDKAVELEYIRKLRDIATLDHFDAKLELCRYYSSGCYGGISHAKAMSFIRDLVHSVPAVNTQDSVHRSQELTASMRYILVDWLAEVSAMKMFPTHTFHIAVGMVDRFMHAHPVTRSQLQLLGVSAMVLCSRYLGADIITIREAAWLTDNTYKYEDVVRMLGEIMATLRGRVRTATSIDFTEVFSTLLGHDRRLQFLAQYICELALLQSEMGQYSPGETAASAILLSRLLTHEDDAWPMVLQEATGFCIEDLNRCAFHMHEKCFLEGSVVDHRDVKLQAVKLRYADEDKCKVSEIEIISYKELCELLSVTKHIVNGRDVHVRFCNNDELIVSPSQKKSRASKKRAMYVSTPKSSRKRIIPNQDRVRLNDSVSGYEGDEEDDLDESIIIDESIEDLKRELQLDEGLGEMPNDSFLSDVDSNRSPLKAGFNLSAASPYKHCLSFSSSNLACDTNSTSGISSGASLSPGDSGDSEQPCSSTSSQGSCSGISSMSSSTGGSFINLKSTSMTLRSASATTGACGFLSSDSEANCDVDAIFRNKRARNGSSPSHMTLRNTPKRTSSRKSSGKTYIFK